MPVAAKLPYKVMSAFRMSGMFFRNISAANEGPIVWLEEGPCPILYISFIVLIVLWIMYDCGIFCLTKFPFQETSYDKTQLSAQAT